MQTYPGEMSNTNGAIEPRIGSVRASVRLPFLRRALRPMTRAFASTPLKHLHPRGVVVARPDVYARQAVVKVWMTSAASTARHLSYLAHEGKGGPEQPAELFTAEHHVVDRATFIQAATRDGHQHRLMLSIVDHAEVDLQRLTRAFMTQVQTDLGRRVAWVAAVHRDTAHPHIHVLLRGCDVNGQPIHLRRDYRTHGLRYQLQHLVTAWLGPAVHQVTPEPIHPIPRWQEIPMAETPMPNAAPPPEHVAYPTVPTQPKESLPAKRLTPEEAQRRLEDTRQRTAERMARLRARGQRRAPAQNAGDDVPEPTDAAHEQRSPSQHRSTDRGMTR